MVVVNSTQSLVAENNNRGDLSYIMYGYLEYAETLYKACSKSYIICCYPKITYDLAP